MTECMTSTCDNDGTHWVHWEGHGRIRCYCDYHFNHLDGKDEIDLATIKVLGSADES